MRMSISVTDLFPHIYSPSESRSSVTSEARFRLAITITAITKLSLTSSLTSILSQQQLPATLHDAVEDARDPSHLEQGQADPDNYPLSIH